MSGKKGEAAEEGRGHVYDQRQCAAARPFAPNRRQ
jgi:hypothetical protein